jgi:hypothetical protein
MVQIAGRDGSVLRHGQGWLCTTLGAILEAAPLLMREWNTEPKTERLRIGAMRQSRLRAGF